VSIQELLLTDEESSMLDDRDEVESADDITGTVAKVEMLPSLTSLGMFSLLTLVEKEVGVMLVCRISCQ
jgi:hypothetical protein